MTGDERMHERRRAGDERNLTEKLLLPRGEMGEEEKRE
jgi:hypothetical protein